MTARHEVARLQARGSTRHGFAEWKLQRLTALANLPLLLWLVLSLVGLSGSGYEEVRAWLAGPLPTTLLCLTIVATVWHARIGVQVIVEDYVHDHRVAVAALVALRLAAVALAALGLVAVLKVSFGS
jgi:succinate dehydrogenase / fumarate reductase membrane anchor subunit